MKANRKEIIASLRQITRYAVKGDDRYKSTNPYTKSDIRQALVTLAKVDGVSDHLDVDLDKWEL